MLKYVWTKFEILTPYISWDTVHFVEISQELLLHFYGFSMGYIWGKTNFEKTSPKEFFDAFMMIWAWKSGFNSWNQNFRKCTLFVWSTVSSKNDYINYLVHELDYGQVYMLNWEVQHHTDGTIVLVMKGLVLMLCQLVNAVMACSSSQSVSSVESRSDSVYFLSTSYHN